MIYTANQPSPRHDPFGSAEERFVQAVRLASCDLNVKIGGGQGVDTPILTGVYFRRALGMGSYAMRYAPCLPAGRRYAIFYEKQGVIL